MSNHHIFSLYLGYEEFRGTLCYRITWIIIYLMSWWTVQFSQSCLTLCNPMDCSSPGIPVHHQLPKLLKFISIESVMPSNNLILCCPFSSCLQYFPASESFPMSQFFTSGGQSIEVSTSTSVLPMNIQDWFPLGWTGWISLQSKGLSRVLSNTTVQKQHFGEQMYNRLKGRWTKEIITGSLYISLLIIIWEL